MLLCVFLSSVVGGGGCGSNCTGKGHRKLSEIHCCLLLKTTPQVPTQRVSWLLHFSRGLNSPSTTHTHRSLHSELVCVLAFFSGFELSQIMDL